MKIKARLLSVLLTFCMLFSTFAAIGLTGISSYADETAEPTTTATATETAVDDSLPAATKLRTQKFKTEEEKLATMTKYLTAYGYEIYAFEASGEVAVKNTKTGEILFTNPFDANQTTSSQATSSSTPTTYELIMSQLVVDYQDQNGSAKQMCSFTSAAESEQISVSYVRNGISVSYAIGRSDSRRLCPMCVTKEFMEESILAYIEDENDRKQVYPFRYFKVDIFDPNEQYTQETIDRLVAAHKAAGKMAIYYLNEGATNYDKNKIESILKAWCPHISFETIEEQHTITEYEAKAAILPCFRMSLIYRVDENGLEIMLPANSITFNEDFYTLKTITVLPYLGAGNANNNGFTFIPDGTGSIIEFKDVSASTVTMAGTLYGADYAYHTLPTSFTGKNEQMRFPVFGVVNEKKVVTKYALDDEGNMTDKIYCEHQYEDVVTPPTCTEDGFTTSTCILCSEDTPGHKIIRNPVPACHTYDENDPASVDKSQATTCLKLGQITYTCTVCGDVKVVKDTELTEHNYVGTPAEGLPGITTFTCTICNDSYKTEHALHTLKKVASITPVCTESNYEGMVLNTYAYINKQLTAFVKDTEILKYPVGTKVTFKDGTVGTVSEYSYYPVSREEIGAFISAAEVGTNNMPTSEYTRCKVVIDVDISDIESIYDVVSTKSLKVSAPKVIGSGYSLYLCAECGYTEKRDFSSDTHSYKIDNTKTVKASCVNERDGSQTYVCEYCGEVKEVVTPWAHTWADKATGKSQTYVTALGKVIDSSSPLAKYQLSIFPCTADGCTATIEKTTTCPKNAGGEDTHIWDTGERVHEADCTHYLEIKYTCKLCMATKTEKSVNFGHKYEKILVPATCYTEGYTEYKCSLCGEHYFGDYVSSAHEFEETKHDYTCTEDGYTHFFCPICTYEYDGDIVPAAHRFEETERLDAVCATETNGYVKYKCSQCPETSEEVLEWAHDWSKTIIVEVAESDKDGERYSFCKVCFKENHEVIPAFGTGGLKYKEVTTLDPAGYVAIITEGESFSTINAYHGGPLHPYNSTYITVNPRPSDEYNLRDSLSVGADAKWIVTSDRRYTGNYTMRLYMLSNREGASFDADISGMAEAYRTFLINTGVLRQLDDNGKDIPLYIEALGATKVQKTVLSFPVSVSESLTSFDDLIKMSDDLKAYGITNVNYRLTGFANGGTNPTVPNRVSFESVVGGNSGYTEFIEYADKNGIGVFPEFDYSYLHGSKLFDGYSSSKDAIKTIDDRYIIKKEYDPTYQMFKFTGLLAISPSSFMKFYNKLSPALTKLGYKGISSSTLGTDLNSDFDTDDPYNREDNKKYVTALLAKMQEDSGDNVMIDGGNAYTFKYVKHILNMSSSSSKSLNSSASVPFIGMVLHSFVNYSATPTNEASNINYEILKMIENGSNPYFILCADNTEALKESNKLNKYYSVAYDIWMKNENTTSEYNIVDIYNRANEALKDVQNATYDGFEYLKGERVIGEAEKTEYLETQTAKLAELKEKYDAAEKAFTAAQDLYKRFYKEGKETVAEQYYDNIADKRTVRNDARTAYNNLKNKLEAKIGYGENGEYNTTEFTVDDESIAYVEYSNGIFFILNYNNFAVTVDLGGELITVEAMDYYKGTKN